MRRAAQSRTAERGPRGLTLALPLLVVACAGRAAPPDTTVTVTTPSAAAPSMALPSAPSEWAEVTRSPWPPVLGTALSAREATLASACGTADGALVRVAARLAVESGAPDPDRVAALLRASGEPHVRPRVVSVRPTSGAVDGDALVRKLTALRHEDTRCGTALVRNDAGVESFVAIAIEPAADLDPLPTRARTGGWLHLTAKVRAPATGARVILLGPRGIPRSVPTSFDRASGSVTASFALDRPGGFTVQLVGDLEGGPRPLLEARVFADTEPPPPGEIAPAPGEDPAGDDADALERMVATLPLFRRDPRLDRLAEAHASAMRAGGTIAHDVGDGDLATRFEAEGLAATVVGENVARAGTVALAHRALHGSPSHRLNLLHAQYTHLGVAVLKDESGRVYVCEVFSSSPR